MKQNQKKKKTENIIIPRVDTSSPHGNQTKYGILELARFRVTYRRGIVLNGQKLSRGTRAISSNTIYLNKEQQIKLICQTLCKFQITTWYMPIYVLYVFIALACERRGVVVKVFSICFVIVYCII